MANEQRAIKVWPATFWELKQLALTARLSISAYLYFLVKSGLARQAHPGVRIDTPGPK